jgi:hypothetical protein
MKTPKAFRLSAQGCRVREATLGMRAIETHNPNENKGTSVDRKVISERL